MSRSKQAVSNFISRSLRGRRKAKNSASVSNVLSPSSDSTLRVLPHPQEGGVDFFEGEDDDDDDLDTQLTSSLISPVERKFTLSTVMHIYYTEGKQAQVYKSVLVSEKATTQEVIAQALERYNIKSKRPEDYTLFDVIGKWQAVTSTAQSQLSYQTSVLGGTGVVGGGGSIPLKPVSTLPNNLNILNASPLIKRRTAVEEFVVCYCRELAPHESPYNAQFYLTTQEGFTRRFELKSKGDPSPLMSTRGSSAHHEKSHSVDIMERPDDQATPTPAELDKNVEEEDMGIVFGITSHNRKRSKRNRIVNQSIDSADPDSMEITILKDSTLKSSNSRGQGRVGTVRAVRESKNGRNDELDSEIPITMMSRGGAPDFSALQKSMDSSPDNFHRNHHHHHHHNSHTQKRSSPGSAHTPSSPSHYATTTISPTSSFSERSDQSSAALCPISNLECAFLLNLRICSPSKEHLVYRLLSDDVKLGSWSSPNGGNGPSTEKIHLHSPEFSQMDGPICCICRQPISDATPPLTDSENSMKFSFIIKRAVSSKTQVLVNGEEVSSSVSLKHGDVISIGETGLFMFNDVTSFSAASVPLYRWKPHPLTPPFSSSTIRSMSMSTSIETITEFSTSSKAAEKSVSREIPNHSKLPESPASSSSLTSPPSSHSPMSTRRVKGHFTDMQEAKRPQHINNNGGKGGGGGGGKIKDATLDSDTKPTPNGLVANRDRSLSQNKRSTNQVKAHQVLTKTRSLPLPKERKLVFSFKATEEDHLLSHIISDQSYRDCFPCKLAPVYILAMCTEYCMMSSGPDAVARFVQKAIDRIQGTVWDFTKKLESWQPEESDIPRSPGAVLKKLFPLLEPVFFWLANTLEFYNFLTTNREELHLPAAQKGSHQRDQGAEEGEEDALGTLYSVLVYTYQKAFYPVSKVLYQSLPQMLESCVEESLIESKEKRPIVIGEAVGFLQALLELINEQNLHLEVVSQFYANIFFFVNTAMFNALVEQGGELGLYQYHSGTALRKNLSLLEGWACQVGFKDSVLHYLAKFSGAIDLLATPTEKLLKMNWSDLRYEFPVLQPVQLHFLLSQYLLPPSITEVPRHWTPSKQDALHALTGSSLQESFDSHPGLELPSSGYALDLNQPPAEGEQFQGILEKLRSHLQQFSAETDTSSSPSEKVRNYSNSTKAKTAKNSRNDFERGGGGKEKEFEIMDIRDTAPNGYNSGHAQTIVGSDTESREDLHVVTASLLSSAASKQRNIRNLEKNFRYHHQQQRHAHYPQQLSNNNNNNDSSQTANIMDSFQYRNGTTTTTTTTANLPFHSQKVECVRSMLGPRSYSTPEKLVLNSDSTPASSGREGCSWRDRFPRGSKAVTIPRGDKGFGFIMVEKRDPGNNESLIVVQQVLPGSTAAQCTQLRAGDHILAIDGQLLDGADYLIADKYVKEAEDDVTLTLAPRTLL